jgi:hypothetical protein
VVLTDQDGRGKQAVGMWPSSAYAATCLHVRNGLLLYYTGVLGDTECFTVQGALFMPICHQYRLVDSFAFCLFVNAWQPAVCANLESLGQCAPRLSSSTVAQTLSANV